MTSLEWSLQICFIFSIEIIVIFEVIISCSILVNPAIQPYLNIRVERHVKPEGDEPEPKKLAIGGEGGFNPDAKPWIEKSHYRVCIADKYFELDQLPEQLAYVKSCCEAVIQATSVKG